MKQQATFLKYSTGGDWQSEKTVNLDRLGMSRSFLSPDREYQLVKLATELGPKRKCKLHDFWCSGLSGSVALQNEYDNEKSPEVLLQLAIQAGAIAFVATKHFELEKNKVYPIPIYVLPPDWQSLCSVNRRIRVDHRSSEQKQEGTASWSEWVATKGISNAVVEEMECCGVKNVQDAAFWLLYEKDRQHKQMLAAQAEQDAEQRVIFPDGFTLKNIGVGGLGKDFEVVFRRLFASRMFSASKLAALGISHCKGLLLNGPSGCGKTLLARQLSKLLKTKTTKIISGPEVFNKWMGQSEANVRDLFKEAEDEYRKKGNKAGLHVVIIDEIDACCSKRSQSADVGSRVASSVVNQLLAKMDGVEQIDNILLIGMTNRKEAIDPALLRPGRFELVLEIGLPDEAGRREILDIHTKKMRDGGLLDEATAACLSEIAAATENFCGAEIESIVKGACSIAMDRCIDPMDLSLEPDEDKLRLTPDDFRSAMKTVLETKY